MSGMAKYWMAVFLSIALQGGVLALAVVAALKLRAVGVASGQEISGWWMPALIGPLMWGIADILCNGYKETFMVRWADNMQLALTGNGIVISGKNLARFLQGEATVVRYSEQKDKKYYLVPTLLGDEEARNHAVSAKYRPAIAGVDYPTDEINTNITED